MKICIPLRQKNLKKLIDLIPKASSKADVVEIWFDELDQKLDQKSLQEIFRKTKKPILYKSFGEKSKIEEILKFKPGYIDLDLKTPTSLVRFVRQISPKTKIIISHHDFEKTPGPAKIKSIIKKSYRKGADIAKIAVTADKIGDSLELIKILEEFASKKPLICLAMGKAGKITRSTGHLFGNYLSYASLDSRSGTAPGQITVDELKKIVNII